MSLPIKEHGNRAAARHFEVNEKQVREWRKQEDMLRVSKKSLKAKRGNKARWPELETALETWVLEQRAACRGVNTV